MSRSFLALILMLLLAGCGLDGPLPREREQARKPEESPSPSSAPAAATPTAASPSTPLATRPSKRAAATPSVTTPAVTTSTAATASYATPQEVFDAQQKAVADKDWATILATVTPESQEAMVGGIAVAAAQVAATDRQMAEVLKKYGIRAEKFRLTPAELQGGNVAELTKRMLEKRAQLLPLIADKPRFFVKDFL